MKRSPKISPDVKGVYSRIDRKPVRTLCRFCRRLPETVLETPYLRVILSDQPLSRGHCLVMPKRHVERFEMLSKEETFELAWFMRLFVSRLLRAVGAHDYNILVNTGKLAGQTVRHLHIHVIPRHSTADPMGLFMRRFERTRCRPETPSDAAVRKLRRALVSSSSL